MDTKDFECRNIFDTNIRPFTQVNDIAHSILEISQVTIDFAAIERIPRYNDCERENNAEHSFMLALAGVVIAEEHYPEIDSGLVAKFALVHDLPELITNDVPTFKISSEQLTEKEAAEKQAVHTLSDRINGTISGYLKRYEAQIETEARFVRHIDKLLPYAVDANGSGVKVMEEDYETHTRRQLLAANSDLEQRFEHMFPEPSHDKLHESHSVLAYNFSRMLPED